MSNPLAKPGSTSIAPRETAAQPLELLPPAFSGFFNFSYTVTELRLQGKRTSVHAHHTRLEDGKLTTETFEGTLDRSAYAEAVQAAQQQLQAQLAWMQQALTWWLPLLPGQRRGGD
ncbi:hypothetical protein [uncultured Azohydromonas sp.]|jgi:hypothetical protein|uniref:hypothetical protein n=1 Tax=uncultured Azohydromonas sp. TaxID=487342 RepID=UPI0026333D1A|nr:hypothetical protein [uncultured Azohydromonas sp.]